VTIDKNRLCLIVDGKPFFPIGCCHIDRESMKACGQAGFNVTIRWGGPSRFGRRLKESLASGESEARRFVRDYLDAAHAAGLKVIEFPILFGYDNLWYNAPDFSRSFSRFVEDPLPKVVEWVRDHPALLTYYGPDEPDCCPYGATDEWRKQLGEYSAMIRHHDPGHPLYFMFDGGAGPPRQWSEVYDVLGNDPYPMPDRTPLLLVYHSVAGNVALARKKGVPYWSMPLMSYTSGSRHHPLPPEAQVPQIYLSLIAGANGIIWWVWPAQHAEVWRVVRQLAGEMRDLTAVLTETPSPTHVEWEPAWLCNTIQARAIRHDGRTWLIAVNPTPTAARVHFALPAAVRESPKVWFEDREAKIAGGRLDDRFGPYERHVYEIPAQWSEDKVIRLQVQLDPKALAAVKSRGRAAVRGNLLVDPGFEDGRGWTFSTYKDPPTAARGSMETKLQHGGKRVAVITRNGAHSQSTWVGPEVALKPNTLYLFGGWARAMTIGNPVVELFLRDPVAQREWDVFTTRSLYIPHFTPWRCQYALFRSGAEPVRSTPVCGFSSLGLHTSLVRDFQADGKAWFDDLFLLEAPAGVRNLIANGSFEGREVLPGWPEWWAPEAGGFRCSMAGIIGGPDAIWGSDASTAYEGRKSLRVVRPPTKTHPNLGAGPFVATCLLPPGTALSKGRSYVFSAYFKADQSGFPVHMMAGGFDVGGINTYHVSPEWQRYVLAFECKANERNPFIEVLLLNSGTLWIDAVQLEEGTEPTEYSEWRYDLSDSPPASERAEHDLSTAR